MLRPLTPTPLPMGEGLSFLGCGRKRAWAPSLTTNQQSTVHRRPMPVELSGAATPHPNPSPDGRGAFVPRLREKEGMGAVTHHEPTIHCSPTTDARGVGGCCDPSPQPLSRWERGFRSSFAGERGHGCRHSPRTNNPLFTDDRCPWSWRVLRPLTPTPLPMGEGLSFLVCGRKRAWAPSFTTNQQSTVHRLPSVLCPLSSVLCPLSSVLCPLSSVLCLPSSVRAG